MDVTQCVERADSGVTRRRSRSPSLIPGSLAKTRLRRKLKSIPRTLKRSALCAKSTASCAAGRRLEKKATPMMIWIAVLCILLSGVAASEALAQSTFSDCQIACTNQYMGCQNSRAPEDGRRCYRFVCVMRTEPRSTCARRALSIQAASWPKLSPGLASVRRRGPDLDRTNSAQATQGSVSAQRSV